jgi:hypothetical protein
MPQHTQPCTNTQHFGNWRTCDKCARRRQNKIANRAEAIEKANGPLWFTRITPNENSGTAIRRLRAALLRQKISTSGIWTIETGEKYNHLHLNLITPQPSITPFHNIDIFTEPVTTSARAVAAYISKRSAAPSQSQYDGRLFGSWGQIGQFMPDRSTAPIIQAAALNDLIITPHTRQPVIYSFAPEHNPNPEPRLTREQYQELARKHLSALYAATERRPQDHLLSLPAGCAGTP